eukprot:UC1_evm1s1232
MPPRWALGFLGGCADWTLAKLDSTLTSLRNATRPIDAVISGAGWASAVGEAGLGPNGSHNYSDFGYNSNLFPKGGAEGMQKLHKGYDVRFGGRRVPRLGNATLLAHARSMPHFLYPDDSRSLNFSNEPTTKFYSEHLANYVRDGVDFFWNDDGPGMRP